MTEAQFHDLLREQLSTRAFNTIRRLNVACIEDLRKLSRDELMATRHCGRNTAREIMWVRSKLCDEAPQKASAGSASEQEAQDRELQTAFERRLGTRARNVLRRLGVESVSDFVGLSEDEVLGVPYCGDNTLREIVALRNEVVEALSGDDDGELLLAQSLSSRVHYMAHFIRLSSRSRRSAPEDLGKEALSFLLDRYAQTRARTVIRKMGISSVGRFLSLTVDELSSQRGCGKTTIGEITGLQNDLREALALEEHPCATRPAPGSGDRAQAGAQEVDRGNSSAEAVSAMARYGAFGDYSLAFLSPLRLLIDPEVTMSVLAEILTLMAPWAPHGRSRPMSFLHMARHSLSWRSFNVIQRAGILSAEAFTVLTEAALRKLEGCGPSIAAELCAFQSRLRATGRHVRGAVEQSVPPEDRLRAVRMSERAIRALRELPVETITDLLRMGENDVLRISGCGPATVDEVLHFRAQVAAVVCGDRQLAELSSSAEEAPGNAERVADEIWGGSGAEALVGTSVRDLVCASESGIREALKGDTADRLLRLRDQAIEITLDEMEHGVPWCEPPERPQDTTARQSYPLARAAAVSCRSRRDFDIVVGRLGILGEQPVTLEELSQRHGLTRERVRQIATKTIDRMMANNSWLAELRVIRAALLNSLRRFGGVSSLSEMIKDAIAHDELPDELRHSIPVHQMAIELQCDPEERVEFDGEICELGISSRLLSLLAEVVEREASKNADERHSRDAWSIDLHLLKSRLLQRCWEVPDLQQVQRISGHVIQETIDGTTNLRLENRRVYARALWLLRFGSRTEATEEILRQSKQPMDAEAIAEAMERWQPENGPVSANSVRNYVSSCRMALTWDRGTYVHKYNVSLPTAALAKIEREIIERLRTGIPFYCVHGSLQAHKAELAAAGLESEMGLYSCLRDRGNRRLDFPRYPYAVARGVERVPVSVAFEEFAVECGGPFQIGELRAYASQELGMSDVAVGLHVYDIPSVVCVDEGMYCHVSHIPCNRSSLAELEAVLVGDMRRDQVVSIRALYDRRKVRCMGAGIRTPRMLYHMLEHYGTDKLVLLGFPRVSLSGEAESGRIRDEFEAFLREAHRVCSYEELEEEFISKRGFRSADLYQAANSESICRYARGALVHVTTIEWGKEKTVALATAADEAIARATEAGRPYQYIEWFIESQGLPELGGALPWTPTLAVDRLHAVERFAILGTAQAVFVKLPNECGIRSFADLIRHILETEYSGAAELTRFEEELVERKLISRHITQSMLGEDGPVTICGNVISLTELARDA